jgi:hypothetical protein
MAAGRDGEEFPTRRPTSTETSFDDLARGLASGAVSRRQALRLAGAAVVSAALVPLLPGTAEALTRRQRRRCRKRGGTICGSGRREYCCPSGTVCGPNRTCPTPECQPGQTQSCYTGPSGTEGVGACRAGTRTCQSNGTFGPCEGEVTPQPETCNGIDDDCDGLIDEGNPGGGQSCDTGLLGICAAGTTACRGGVLVCEQNEQPREETCNGLDDDCDGQVDEGNPGGGAVCNTGLDGACSTGITNCVEGVIVCTPPPGC